MCAVRDVTADNLRRQSEAARALLDAIAVGDDADLTNDMIEGETTLLEAVDRAISEIDECGVMAVGLKAKEAEFATRRTRVERRTETLRGLLEQALLVSGVSTIKTATATLTVKTVPPKPIIHDESQLPAKFWRTPDPVLDRVAVNKSVKAGEIPSGVSMTNGTTSLQIRRS